MMNVKCLSLITFKRETEKNKLIQVKYTELQQMNKKYIKNIKGKIKKGYQQATHRRRNVSVH